MTMKGLCKALASIVFVLGTIGSIVLANTFGNKINYSTFTLERDVATTMGIFLMSFLTVLVLSVILYSIGEVLENQKEIHEMFLSERKPPSNTPLCGPNALATDSPVKISSKPVFVENNPATMETTSAWDNFQSWTCTACKRVNDSRQDLCICGASKPD